MKRFLLLFLLIIAFCCTQKDALAPADRLLLFAAPAQSELNEISTGWQKRNLVPDRHEVIQERKLLNGKYTLKILAYTVAGLSQYGALLVPQGAGQLPVRLLINGFGPGITTNAVSLTSTATWLVLRLYWLFRLCGDSH